MTAPESGPELWARLPLGRLLQRVLRLLLAADLREVFLGDLIEEGHLRLRVSPPAEVARWLWRETLRSAPALIGWRLRRLLARAQPLPAAVMFGPRGGHRGWTLSLAVSLSAHALALLAVVAWVFSRVDELDPANLPQPIAMDVLDEDRPAEADEVAGPAGNAEVGARPPVQARVRRLKPTRRPGLQAPVPVAEVAAGAPAPAALPAAPPAVAAAPTAAPDPGVPAGRSALLTAGFSPSLRKGPPAGEPRLRLPPRVGEKRCLSCPSPQLPHPYARLGIGQEMLVQACVNVRGEVSSAKVLRGFDPVVDAKVVETVRGWRMAPFSLDGHPVPFCYTTRFLFTTH